MLWPPIPPSERCRPVSVVAGRRRHFHQEPTHESRDPRRRKPCLWLRHRFHFATTLSDAVSCTREHTSPQNRPGCTWSAPAHFGPMMQGTLDTRSSSANRRRTCSRRTACTLWRRHPRVYPSRTRNRKQRNRRRWWRPAWPGRFRLDKAFWGHRVRQTAVR